MQQLTVAACQEAGVGELTGEMGDDNDNNLVVEYIDVAPIAEEVRNNSFLLFCRHLLVNSAIHRRVVSEYFVALLANIEYVTFVRLLGKYTI